MDEDKPTDTLQGEEHIYLDVIHIASRPPSKKSLCSTDDDSLRVPNVQNATAKEKAGNKKSGNLASCVLIALVIFLSAICCTLGALYAIERRRGSMLERENSKRVTTPVLITNCTTEVSTVSTGEELDCSDMEFAIETAKALYNKKCIDNRTGKADDWRNQDHNTADHNANRSPSKECAEKSLLFSSTSDMVTLKSRVTMASATVCFWSKTSPGVSFYVKYKEPNRGKGFDIFQDKSVQSSVGTGWHSFCWTWSTGEEFNRSYRDGRLFRHKEINRETRMPGGGTWELGLRYDTPGGQGSRSNAKPHGEVTSLNIWAGVLRKNQLVEIMTNCISARQGNVKSWQDFKAAARGNVKLVMSGCCKT